MAALIGDSGDAVFEELDAQASAFSQESLQQIAHLVDTGEMPEGATSDALAQMVAIVGSGVPSRQNEQPADIDLRLFAETGFTTSAMLAWRQSAIQRRRPDQQRHDFHAATTAKAPRTVCARWWT